MDIVALDAAALRGPERAWRCTQTWLRVSIRQCRDRRPEFVNFICFRPQIPTSSQQPAPGDTRASLASWLRSGILHTWGLARRARAELAQPSHPPGRPGLLGPGLGESPPSLIS